MIGDSGVTMVGRLIEDVLMRLKTKDVIAQVHPRLNGFGGMSHQVLRAICVFAPEWT
jgi:hypothetical protein